MLFATIFRSYIAHFAEKGGVWPAVHDAVARLKLGPSPEVLFVTDRFQHHDGLPDQKDAPLPSKTITYASLARAVAAGDAKLFEPGTPNTDWRVRPDR